MSAPTPEAVHVLADDLRSLLKDGDSAKKLARLSIQQRYAWLYNAGYEPRRGGHPGSGSQELNDVARLLGATGAARAKLDQAGKLVAQAVAALLGADKALAELEGLIDAGADRTIVPIDRLRAAQAHDAAIEHGHGEAAQARRLERGERLPADGVRRVAEFATVVRFAIAEDLMGDDVTLDKALAGEVDAVGRDLRRWLRAKVDQHRNVA